MEPFPVYIIVLMHVFQCRFVSRTETYYYFFENPIPFTVILDDYN